MSMKLTLHYDMGLSKNTNVCMSIYNLNFKNGNIIPQVIS